MSKKKNDSSLESHLSGLEKIVSELENGESRVDQAEIDALVAARLDTLSNLAPAFDDDFVFDGIDDQSLYAQAFENLTGSAPREDAEPSYVQGVVDGILATTKADSEDEQSEEELEISEDEEKEDAADERSDSTASLRDALKGAGRSNASSESAYKQRVNEAWKRPLTATK